MSNQSVRQNLNKVGKGKTKLKVNSNQRKQDLKMQERNKMLQLTISLMGHDMEGNIIKVMVRDNCSVGYVARSISRGIIRKIRVVGLIFTVHKKHR